MSQKNETANQLIITRQIKAPRELVFKVFTEAKHLAKWWGPKEFDLTVLSLDVRPGGKFHYKMSAANGFEMYGIFVYHQINAPESIQFVNSFADKDGNIIRAPFFDGKWPLEIMNFWTFTEANGVTTLTLTGEPVNETDIERQTFLDNFASLRQGFGGTFDQLDEYLATL